LYLMLLLLFMLERMEAKQNGVVDVFLPKPDNQLAWCILTHTAPRGSA